MTLPQAEIVDVGALWKTIVAAIVAGVGITLAFSLALLGYVRASDAHGERRGGITVAWALVAAVGLAACIAGIVLGLIVMTDK